VEQETPIDPSDPEVTPMQRALEVLFLGPAQRRPAAAHSRCHRTDELLPRTGDRSLDRPLRSRAGRDGS
jgi:hypothetical protein